MVPENSLQTEGGMQIPSLLAGTEGAIQVNLALIPIVYRSPDARAFEILENPPK